MRKDTQRKNGIHMVRISKRVARKAFKDGFTVFCIPVKCRMFSDFILPYELSKDNLIDDDFDTLVNHIEYYNCNHETGRYLKYYIDISEI